jgi:hypothetical protein
MSPKKRAISAIENKAKLTLLRIAVINQNYIHDKIKSR